MEQYGYTPGVCNIDERARTRWDVFGTIGISTAVALWLVFIFAGFPNYGQLGVLALSWTGFIGIWQSNLPLCQFSNIQFASNSPSASGRMHSYLAMSAALLATAILGAGLLVSPMPASEMRKFYMRVIQSF